MSEQVSQSHIILGIDEVGRGPWAGPLVVGAVILKSNDKTSQFETSDLSWQNNLTDSKKLTPKKRKALSATILDKATATGLGWVSSNELDQYGLSASLKLATRRAVKQILATKTYFDEIIIDGTVNFLKNTPLEDKVTVLPKADFLIREVSAASIIAKVARDQYMADLATTYPGYGFENHAGYGTAAHRQALLELGVTPEHRKSFRPIREIIEKANATTDTDTKTPTATSIKSPTTSDKGKTAELAASNYLTTQGHQIIAQNFKTKVCEIDLISVKGGQIFFTEVKYSQNPTLEGTPLTRITPEKQSQMQFAAEFFLNSHPSYQKFNPILAAASVTGKDYKIDGWIPLI